MIPLSVGQIAEITGAVRDPVADPAAIVTGPVVIDSRQAEPGSLFAALPGRARRRARLRAAGGGGRGHGGARRPGRPACPR